MKIKKTFVLSVVFLVLGTAIGYSNFEGRPLTGVLQLNTAHTLNQGEVLVGLGPVSYGFTDTFEAGTNLLLLFLGVNAYGKLNLVGPSADSMGYSVGAGFFRIDFGDIGGVTGIPIFAAATQLLDETNKLHYNIQFTYFSADIGDESTGSVSGTSFSAGWESQLNNRTIAMAEAGYDFSFNSLRLGGGVLFGGDSFRLKLGAMLLPDVFPVLGLWWRFQS